MKKGGYKIIDLKGLDVTTSGGVTIDGIYDTIEGSYGKPLLLAGINLGGVEKNDIYVIPVLSGDDYTFTGYGKVFTIDDDDKVTITNESSVEIITLSSNLTLTSAQITKIKAGQIIGKENSTEGIYYPTVADYDNDGTSIRAIEFWRKFIYNGEESHQPYEIKFDCYVFNATTGVYVADYTLGVSIDNT